MVKLFQLKISLLLLVACGSKSPVDSKPTEGIEALSAMYSSVVQNAASLLDGNGWLNGDECDGMLWEGKYQSSLGVVETSIEKAEVEPGRFLRYPDAKCRVSWSRDMGIGMFAYLWKKRDLEIAKRHAKYGEDHLWKMGEPLDDGRVIYTPQVYGLLYQIIYSIGGPKSSKRLWPQVYPSNLDDYQAHLQVMQIWLRSEIAGEISTTMHKRIEEHASRQPMCPLYLFLKGVYNGDLTPTTNILLLGPDSEEWGCDYIRGPLYAKMTEWIFVTGLVLEHTSEKNLTGEHSS